MDGIIGFGASKLGKVLAVALAASCGAPAIAQVTPAERPAAPAAVAPNQPSAAQPAEPTEPNAEPTAPAELTVEDSAILPGIGNQDESAAPTMALDCQRDPESCKTPLTEPTEGPALSVPSGDPTDPGAGAPVVATPKD